MQFEVIKSTQTPSTPQIYNVQEFIKQNNEILLNFLEYAKTKKTAVGLAANQVSVDGERLMLRAFAIKQNDNWKLIINPNIVKYSGIKNIKFEGCLTWENKIIVAERYHKVNVNYFDIDGNEHCNDEYCDFDAQIWQHEVNHLDGIPETVQDNYVITKQKLVGRNDKCPCDSGKKYKNCCLNK